MAERDIWPPLPPDPPGRTGFWYQNYVETGHGPIPSGGPEWIDVDPRDVEMIKQMIRKARVYAVPAPTSVQGREAEPITDVGFAVYYIFGAGEAESS